MVCAAIAALPYGVPHVIYHLAHTEPLSTSDVVGSVGGLALFVLLAGAVLIRAVRPTNMVDDTAAA
jgi:hypothetical protein